MRRLAPHLFVAVLLLAALLTGAHEAVRNLVVDSRFAVTPRAPSGEVVLVAIDSPSLQQIGVWPWPRGVHADLLQRLQQAGAVEIAFDIDFSSASDDISDRRFADALRDADGSVILPAFKQRTSNNSIFYNTPLPAFAHQSWAASVNVLADSDGVVRRYLFGDRVRGVLTPSLAAILGGSNTLTDGSFAVDFGIDVRRIPVVSYGDVLRQDLSLLQPVLSNKKIIVGATALELGDRVNAPGGRIIPGAVLQAIATESVLQKRTLQGSSTALAVALALALSLAVAASWKRLSHLQRAGSLLAIAAMTEIAAWLLQAAQPFILDTSLLHIVVAGYLCAGAAHEIDLRGWLGRIAERRFQRVALSVGDGLACMDARGLITFWNPAAASMFGYAPAEALGKSLSEMLSSEIHGAVSFDVEVLASTSAKLVELQGRRKDGQTFPVEAQVFGWDGKQGAEFGVLLRDISVRKREVQRIRYLASTDTLTGLANRHTLSEHLEAALMEAELERHEVAVLVVDLDRFKEVNDTLGHSFGDELLKLVGQRLKAHVVAEALISRMGGDEFAIVISGVEIAAEADRLARRICRTFKSEPFSLRGRQMRINCSIGISLYPRDTTSPEQLLSSADLALYRAKGTRDGAWSFYTEEIKAALANKVALESELARALERNEFELFYQPQIRLRDRTLVGAEALIRWNHPVRGLIGPGEFMDVVHKSALSNEVAYWVLRNACRQAAAWERQGRMLRVGINLSPSQFEANDLVSAVAEALKANSLTPQLLDLEVTENILLGDDERAADIFIRLRALGVGISFDDFGTGFGSLSQLKKFPFDRLKIDRSFVQEIRNNADDAAIVGSTIGLAKQLGLQVVAEGIEDAAAMDVLIAMGCTEGQGYYFGRPVPAETFEKTWWPSLQREPLAKPQAA